VLTRDAWQCRECGRVCSDKREAHADHIIRIADGGGRYDLANGQTLCVRCHGRKTRAEQSACQAPTPPVPPPLLGGWGGKGG
jgi:5-methylcytosine-specific restriction endonuclease McrA